MTTKRINFASRIEVECLKNPELITNLICIISDELSNSDLERIYKIFFDSKEVVNKKLNLNN